MRIIGLIQLKFNFKMLLFGHKISIFRG